MPEDLTDLWTRESLRIGSLVWAGKPRLAWEQLRQFTDTFAEAIERQPGGLLELPGGHAVSTRLPAMEGPSLTPPGQIDKGDLSSDAGQSAAMMAQCRMGAHSYGGQDSNGWRTCSGCGHVSIT